MTVQRINFFLMILLEFCFLSKVSSFSVIKAPLLQRNQLSKESQKQFPLRTPHTSLFSQTNQCRPFHHPSIVASPPTALSASSTSSSGNDAVTKTAEKEDETSNIQALFDKYASNGLLDKATLETIPPFADLLSGGDLLPEEWTDIWNAAPKVDDQQQTVDAAAFAQIYRDVDDLFEEEDNNDNATDTAAATMDETSTSSSSSSAEEPSAQQPDDELLAIYESISNDDGRMGKDALKEWKEVQNLLTEGLLGEDEFDDLWDEAIKSPGTKDGLLDLAGFLDFNVALDGLFDFDDEEEEDGGDDNESLAGNDAVATPVQSRPMVVEGDMPPGVLFSQLADSSYLVGMDDLKLWVELQDLLEEGDLLPAELQDIYDRYAIDESSGKLTEEGFQKLYDDIDAMFEEDGDNDDGETKIWGASDMNESTSKAPPALDTVKRDLLAFLDLIDDGDEDTLACGLDARDKDRQQVLNIVNALQPQPSNLILQKQGNIELQDLAGTWELIYSSSSAMKFNKGLSGLGGSFPNGRFAGFKQDLRVTKFLYDMEYKERIEVNPSSASFDVSVTGSWDLRTSVSLFTGQPSIILNVEPERVNYGPTSTRADHWKSLGPLNMLDLSYLDDDLRIMRGCTSSDTLFIYKKIP